MVMVVKNGEEGRFQTRVRRWGQFLTWIPHMLLTYLLGAALPPPCTPPAARPVRPGAGCVQTQARVDEQSLSKDDGPQHQPCQEATCCSQWGSRFPFARENWC